jgi:hypothetical protein
VPLFEEMRDLTAASGKLDWHGDSDAFIQIHKSMGKPLDSCIYKGVSVEFRDFQDYVKKRCLYSRNFMGDKKEELMKIWNV